MICAPTAAEWMTAFGTVGAVVASIYFATRDEFRRQYRERREQAEHVTGWLGSEGDEERGAFFNVTVLNSSKQCFYRLIARLVQVHGEIRETNLIGEAAAG